MDIKSKKKEVIARMKPIWDAEEAKYKQENKEWWAAVRACFKCYFTYPWGHISNQCFYNEGYYRFSECMVCGIQFKVR
jgi:hypothetical protein